MECKEVWSRIGAHNNNMRTTPLELQLAEQQEDAREKLGSKRQQRDKKRRHR